MGGREEKMLFHDFMGTSCISDSWIPNPPTQSFQDEIDPRNMPSRPPFSSVSLPSCSSDPGASDRERMSSADFSKRGFSFPEKRIEDNSECSRGIKVPRLESKDERRTGYPEEDVFSSMQAPRSSTTTQKLTRQLSSNNYMVTKKWDYGALMNTGAALYGPLQAVVHPGVGYPDRSFRLKENGLASSTHPCPPADEGSRTGIKGSGLASLINKNNNEVPCKSLISQGPSAGTLNPMAGTAAQETFGPLSMKRATAPCKQLTVFYGGQAHVFDDVHPSKADAILSLAGSNGRSWSTTYSPRARSSMKSSKLDENASSAIREKPGFLTSNKTSSTALDMPSDFQGGNKDMSLINYASVCANESEKEAVHSNQQFL